MGSQAVLDRQTSADWVLSLEQTQLPSLYAPLGALVGGDGAGAVGYAASLLSSLRTRRDGMVAADEAHELELGGTPGVLAERDAAVTDLRAAIIAGPNTAIGVWGEDGSQRAGWTGATPTDPAALPGYARAIAKGLLDVGGSLPTAEGASWDPTSLRTRLSAGADALDAANTAPELASRVRPSQSRPGRTEVAPEPVEPEA